MCGREWVKIWFEIRNSPLWAEKKNFYRFLKKIYTNSKLMVCLNYEYSPL